MAIFWTAKAPTAVVSYEWTPAPDEVVQSVTSSATGAVIDSYSVQGDTVTFFVSGGTAGKTAQITATAITGQGETLAETIYLPIIATGSAAGTVQDIVSFALRKITGLGETPTAEQASDAVERLQDMLSRWRVTGADVGAPQPLTLTTVVYTPDELLGAIKSNLAVELADLYGFEPSATLRRAAMQGLVALKMRNLPDERTGVYY